MLLDYMVIQLLLVSGVGVRGVPGQQVPVEVSWANPGFALGWM